jgi:hypothetical protein
MSPYEKHWLFIVGVYRDSYGGGAARRGPATPSPVLFSILSEVSRASAPGVSSLDTLWIFVCPGSAVLSSIVASRIDDRMAAPAVGDSRVWDVWCWCSEAYLRYGRKLTLPAGTDPTKTYQWRYATAIAKKFDEWDFDMDTAKQFIDVAIRHSQQSGTMQKGLAALHQANILSVCYEKLKAETKENRQALDSLQYIRDWLRRKSGKQELTVALLARQDPDGLCNLVMWYQASRITPLFMALSRSCSRALAQLGRDHQDERGLLPRQTTLYIVRTDFLRDSGNASKAREILAHDWRESCPLPS